MNRSTLLICSFICILEVLYAVCDNATSTRPTIFEKPFKVNDDVSALSKNVQQKKPDVKEIINILGARTSDQRAQINQVYNSTTGKSLAETLYYNFEAGSDIQRTLSGLALPIIDYMVLELDWSLGEDHDWLYAIVLCSASGQLLRNITNDYTAIFKGNLSNRISQVVDQKSSVQFLMNVVDDSVYPLRSDSDVDKSKIPDQLKDIPDHDGSCTFVDNRGLNKLLSRQSFVQIKAVAMAYQKKTSKSVTDQFGKFCKEDDLRLVYTMIVTYALDPPSFFARQLYDAMARVGTKDHIVSFIIIWRSDIDLEDIKDAYQRIYNKALHHWVKDETSGDYRDLLIKLLDENK